MAAWYSNGEPGHTSEKTQYTIRFAWMAGRRTGGKMGTLFTIGLLFIVALAVIVIATVIGLFVGNIILFESIGIAIAAGCLASYFLDIHPAFCVLIGIGVLIGLYFLMNTKIGFWVIGGLMSLLWGFCVSVFVYSGTDKDMIWTYVSWGLVALFILALHLRAKSRNK